MAEPNTSINWIDPLLIGSRLMGLVYPDWVNPDSDYDYIAYWDEFQKLRNFAKTSWKGKAYFYPVQDGKKWIIEEPTHGKNGTIYSEFEIAWPGTTARTLRDKFFPEALHDESDPQKILNLCYTLKMSHRYLKNSPAFHKTRLDILRMRQMGAEIFDQEWYEARVAETYWYEHPNLNRTKEEFFVDIYAYDHDEIHEAVAVDPGVPAYTKYMRSGSEVQWDSRKFFGLPLEVRIAGVYEEAGVLALERSIIPYGEPEALAFPFALEKVCTSITSGLFREFAWEHWDDVIQFWLNRGNRLAEAAKRLQIRNPDALVSDKFKGLVT